MLWGFFCCEELLSKLCVPFPKEDLNFKDTIKDTKPSCLQSN